MNEIFKELLESHIELDFKKIIKEKNKKVISTSIFLPENPSISIKTPVYILGLIKLVENFHKFMDDKWILRIYYDSMFDKGIKLKKLDKIVEEEQHDKQEQNNSGSLYEYEYNTMKQNPQNKIDLKEIKRNIMRNKIYLKKLLKLMYLYLEHIKTSKDKKYSRIELVSYDCQNASNYPNIIGHPATFGSIMRFMTLYDEDVDIFFCINSRYPITPLQKLIIDNWDKDPTKKMYGLIYEANHFMPSVTINSFHIPAHLAKSRMNSGKQTMEDELLKSIINSIYDLKDNMFKVAEKTLFENKKQVSERHSAKLLNGVTYSGFDKYYKFELGMSIGAGFFGYKKNCPLHINRISIYAALLNYYIITKNNFKFGIDELLLKTALAFEIGTCNMNQKKNTITYLSNEIKLPTRYIFSDYLDSQYYNISNLKTNESWLSLGNGKSLILKPNIITNHFIDNSLLRPEMIDIGILESRSLYDVLNGTNNDGKPKYMSLKQSDKIVKCVNQYKGSLEINFSILFNSFEEEKKLFLVDSSRRDTLHIILNSKIDPFKKNSNDYTSLYTVIDLNSFAQKDINNLLKTILKYYNQDFNYHDIKFIEKPREYNNSNESSNSSSNTKKSLKSSNKLGGKKSKKRHV